MSNAWTTYLKVGDNAWKRALIPNVVPGRMTGSLKMGTLRGLSLKEGSAYD